MTAAAHRMANARATPGASIRHEASIVSNREVAEATWWTELDSPDIAAASRPGQFVMIGLGLDNTAAPFLPRPFSVGWRSGDGRIGLLIREFGAGSRRLASLRPGAAALLLGPLGTHFRTHPGRETVCLAGGVGLAPFLFLASEARDAGDELRLLYGERSGARVFDPGLIEELTGAAPEVWTEDGSVGRRGRVLEGVDLPGRSGGSSEALRGRSGGSPADPNSAGPVLMACGPTPMLHAAACFAAQRGLELQVSVEEYMGCGVGTCQGCVVRSADGRWIKSCVEGPVFDAGDLAWEGATQAPGELSWGG